MTAIIIGIVSGILAVLVIQLLKLNNKPVIYGQILTGIGFLYVGFTWTDTPSLIITCIQALCFMFLAYAGVRSNINLLIAGYFLHGIWDFGYHFFTGSELIPPHYDLFCLSIDFTMGAFLILIRNTLVKKMKPAS
ncbi:MAG TPA: hypothetical protein PKC72_06025 [Chitinophagaceae bacterium]|nr:hypothetical protein [Chitinophagaceae bacterium]